MADYISHPAVVLTLQVTFAAMAMQIIIGLPLGLFLAGRKSFAKNIVEIIVTLPMIFPPMALGFFLLLIFGKNGFLGTLMMGLFHHTILFSFWGILIAVFTVGLPFMVKSVQSARQQVDRSIIEAAATLGKSRNTVLFRVILPNIKNGIITGLLLSFGRSLGEVGISLMLGGNIIGRTETLSLAIYNAVFEGEFQKAAELSFVLSVIAILVLVALNLVNRKRLFNFTIK